MPPKILLVDDIEDNLFSIETILEPDGYQFVKARSGSQALKILLKEIDFALILMDVKMPNLDGFETAELIYEREKLRSIPIVFITAHSYGDENIFKGYSSGAVDYIFKPINPGLLRAKVAVFVDLYKKTRALMAQEQKLILANRSLENEIKERRNSEERIKALNQQLLETIDRLEMANKDLDRFAFMASHDLQEPLRKIQTFTDLLHARHGQQLDSSAKGYVSRVQNAAARMQLLIRDILRFSKISTEKETTELSDMNVLLDEVIVELDQEIKDKKATIVLEKLPSVPVYPRLIGPLFQNLIGNALKYSREGVPPLVRIYSEISLAYDTERSVAPGINTYCRIYVEDNGIGFEQKYAEQIFGMFQRLHSKEAYEGTGIGLALCKKIVEEHNGFISARSRKGEGSTFIVSLPVPVQGQPGSAGMRKSRTKQTT